MHAAEAQNRFAGRTLGAFHPHSTPCLGRGHGGSETAPCSQAERRCGLPSPCWPAVWALFALSAALGGLALLESTCRRVCASCSVSASFPIHLPQPGHTLSLLTARWPGGRRGGPLSAVLAGLLCAHPRLIKALGRTQWSLEPGRPDNWLCFDVSQVQNGPRPPGPALHACLFLSLCKPFRFPLPKWGSHHYCCHYPIGNVAKRALLLHPTPPSRRGRKATHDVRTSLHLILVSGCKFEFHHN